MFIKVEVKRGPKVKMYNMYKMHTNCEHFEPWLK